MSAAGGPGSPDPAVLAGCRGGSLSRQIPQDRWSVGERGEPVDPSMPFESSDPDPDPAAGMGVRDSAVEWMNAKGGAPGTRAQREGVVHFVERRLGNAPVADITPGTTPTTG